MSNSNRSNLSVAVNTVSAIIKTLAAGPAFSGQIEASTKISHEQVCIILSSLVKTKTVKMGKGASPKYKLVDVNDALRHAEVIAAGIEL
jgi:DNA-binding IscR family transcriptional regulator